MIGEIRIALIYCRKKFFLWVKECKRLVSTVSLKRPLRTYKLATIQFGETCTLIPFFSFRHVTHYRHLSIIRKENAMKNRLGFLTLVSVLLLILALCRNLNNRLIDGGLRVAGFSVRSA